MQTTRAAALLLALWVAVAGCANVTQRISNLGIGAETSAATASETRAALGGWPRAPFLVNAASDRIPAIARRAPSASHLLWK